MDLQAVNVLIASAIDNLRSELQTTVDTGDAVLETTLGNAFDGVQREIGEAAKKVEETFGAVDAHVSAAQHNFGELIQQLVSDVEDLALQHAELKAQLQNYENQLSETYAQLDADLQTFTQKPGKAMDERRANVACGWANCNTFKLDICNSLNKSVGCGQEGGRGEKVWD